jgi:hypothetical protein
VYNLSKGYFSNRTAAMVVEAENYMNLEVRKIH